MSKSKTSDVSKLPQMEAISDDESFSEKSDTPIDPASLALQSLTDLLENPQNFIHTILLPPSKNEHVEEGVIKSYSEQIGILHSISKALFLRIEKLGYFLEKLENRQKEDPNADNIQEEDDNPLSGLSELYISEVTEALDQGEFTNILIDAETIWSQVDIQNSALLTKVAKSIRKLSKYADHTEIDGKNQIKLLDMENIASDGNNNDDGASSDENSFGDEEEQESNDEEEHDRRIGERMERTMADMSNSDQDDDGDSVDDDDERSHGNDKGEELMDPMRDELNDGFFDLHEMEAFADDEEDMLPDEAFGKPEQPTEEERQDKKKVLPHLRGRAGKDSEVDDDDDDDEFNNLSKRVESTLHRKKYREDEDINALEALYRDAEEDDDDVVNMSAADFFGPPKKPSATYLRRQKANTTGKNIDHKNYDDDEDSWDNHDFDDADDNLGWRDDEGKHDSSSDDDSSNGANNDDMDASSANENNDDDDPKKSTKPSNYAERSNKLKSLTEALEKEALAEKPWQMLGETSATKRPENSLLDMTPEFEFATKMAPIITQEHTESIEEMIKRRILAEDWDDVVPRELPDIGLDKRKGELPEVSQEKSKLSLGELYEREYLKKATGYDKDAEEKETQEEKAKNEMKMLFANICSKLDALSNYHFAPRPVADEVVVKTASTPAIAMEEVIPLHVSDAHAMAPEEIYAKKKGRDGILRGESEMNQADRKKLRQAKKAARRKARQAKLADEKLISRLQPELGLNNPYEKRKMREELQMARASGKVIRGELDANTDFKTSAKFFQRMQDDVQKSLHADGETSGKKRKVTGEESHKSSRLKL